LRKSKIPCRPGESPVAKVDQETGVCDGMVERSGANVPSERSFARLGSFPSSIHWRVRSASAPSNPRMISLDDCSWAVTGRGTAARARRQHRARRRTEILGIIGGAF
jgi:hypothetical protein